MSEMLDGFVKACLVLVESRDPTTAGHSERVAAMTVGLAEQVDAATGGPFREQRFSREQIQALRYASLLHDIGVIGVREKVLLKGDKLHRGELKLVEARFGYVKRSLEAEHLRAQLELARSGAASDEQLAAMDRAHEQSQQELDRLLELVVEASRPGSLDEDTLRTLAELPRRSYVDRDGTRQPLLSPAEVAALSIRRGSLTEPERREIESHVTHSFRFLSQVPWAEEYRGIPEIVYAHHEKLDGSGYPRRLSAPDIPVQSRMMTIADVFDALVAWDRPFKRPLPVGVALDVLHDEAKAGKLDADLLQLFVEARVYELRPSP